VDTLDTVVIFRLDQIEVRTPAECGEYGMSLTFSWPKLGITQLGVSGLLSFYKPFANSRKWKRTAPFFTSSRISVHFYQKRTVRKTGQFEKLLAIFLLSPTFDLGN
jgi:hypothetical protein